MALPVQTDLITLDFVKDGQPWCKVPARSDIDPQTLDIVKDGQPWGVNPYGGTAAVSGTLAGTLGNVTANFAGVHGVAGTGAGTLGQVTGAVTGTVRAEGALTGTLGGITGSLVCRGGQIAGVSSDVTASMTVGADTWEQVQIQFTPSAAGVVEIEAWAYGGTTYSVYVDDLSVSQA